MKTIIIAVTLSLTSLGYAETLSKTVNINGNSYESCKEANINLAKNIREFENEAPAGRTHQVILSECEVFTFNASGSQLNPTMRGGYIQRAKVTKKYDGVLGNY